MTDEKQKTSLWEFVKAISTLIAVIVISVKIYVTPTSLTVDFPTLISLLLALFSVALAALFYFKATQTSNIFYDNTYKFTRDIAQLLAKIESGFGERLRHLDEGYSSMRSYLQDKNRGGLSGDVEQTKKQLEDEKQEVHKVIEERNNIVRDLIERSHLQKEEKEQVSNQLKKKEEELKAMQLEVMKLSRRLMMDRARRHDNLPGELPNDEGMNHFTISHVIEKIGQDRILRNPDSIIRRDFGRLVKGLPKAYIEDLERLNYFDVIITPSGLNYLRTLARTMTP